MQSHWQIQNMLKRIYSVQIYGQTAFGNIIHQSKSYFPLRPNHYAFHLHRKTLKSYLNVVNQSRSCNKKEPAEFIGNGRSFLLANHEQIHTEIKCQQIHKIENAHECTKCGKAFLKKSCSVNIREFIQERNTMDVVCVGKPTPRSSSSPNTSELTKKRNPICAVSMEKPFSGNFSLLNKRLLWEINIMYAVYVVKCSSESSS